MQPSRNKTDLFLRILIGALTIVFCVVVVNTIQKHVTELGDTAPNFKVTTDSGKTVTRDNFDGKLLVLNFWATWCAPCLEELPSLDAFARKYADKGVTVLAVSVDRKQERYRSLLAQAKPGFLTFWDPEGNIPVSYGTFMYPETYIIDKQGKVVRKVIAAQNWMAPDFLQEFERLL